MSNETKTNVLCNGRSVIYTSYESINKNNIVKVLNDSIITFKINKNQAKYLDDYRKGIQPILNRYKNVRPEINNKVVVNRASEIVAFKTGYLLTEPIQYVSRSEDDIDVSNKIKELNDLMYDADKEYYDGELADSFSVTGTSYRLVLPTTKNDKIPFKIHKVDTTEAFIVYYSGMGKKPLMGVLEVISRDANNDEIIKYCCYTENEYFEIVNDVIVFSKPHDLKAIPLIEYPNNASRIGDFEIVIPLLDAINLVYSNRLDGVEQFIQSLMKFINVDISEEDFDKLKDLGAIKLKSNGDGKVQDVDFITQEMNQEQVQVLVDSLYQDILTICGMPNRNGGSSTSDTGSAVIMRDGWESAEARARKTELLFRRSEKEFLRIVLNILKIFGRNNLELENIGIRFTRRNYENTVQKSTILTTLLGSDKVHPRLAFENCGLFKDPEVAYLMSEQYRKRIDELGTKKALEKEQEFEQSKIEPINN